MRLAISALLTVVLGLGILSILKDREKPPANYQQVPHSLADNYFFTIDLNPESRIRPLWVRIAPESCYLRLSAKSAQLLTADGRERSRLGRSWHLAERPEHLRIIRKRGHLSVFVNNRLAAEAFLPHKADAPLALAAETALLEHIRFQKIDDLPFTDDFMRDAGDAGNWENDSGEWSVSHVTDASRSANPFRCVGRSTGTAQLLSLRSYWGGQKFEVLAATNDGGSFGISFQHRGNNDHVRLQWNGRSADPADCVRLLKVSDDGERVLAEKPAVARDGQWYRFSVKSFGRCLVAEIDRVARFQVKQSELPGGKVGLFVGQTKDTQFDDVVVSPCVELAEDVFDPRTSIFDTRMPLPEQKQTAHVGGVDNWKDYDFSASLADNTQKAGLAFGINGGSGYYFLMDGSAGEAQLVGADERPIALSNWKKKLKPGPARLAVQTDGGYVRCMINDIVVIDKYLETPPTGRVGLIRSRNEKLSDVRLTFRSPLKQVRQFSRTFENDKQMDNWASLASSWTVGGSGGRPIYWHKADFYGDHSIEAEIPLDKRSDDGGIALRCSRRSLESGYRLALSRNGEGALTAELFRRNKKLAATALPDAGKVRLKLSRRGRYIIAHADDRLVGAHADPEPIDGTRAALWVSSKRFDLHDIDVRCDNIHDFMFEKAPADWIVGGGEWQVANRWTCDRRWSWMCGSSDSIAALWTADEYYGDFTAEFFAACKMQGQVQPASGRYPHPGDINVTVAADGLDPASGYSFIYSGWGGKWTRILRKGKIVGGTDKFAITGNVHRRWFHVKVRRKGRRIEFYVDDDLVRAFTDRDPINGGRIALWSFDNQLVVARVRICAERAIRTQHPLIALRGNSFKSLDAQQNGGDFLVQDTFDDDAGHFAPRESDGTVQLLAARRDESDGFLQVVNSVAGGTIAADVNCGDFSPREYPIVEFDYSIRPGTKVNLYITAGGRLYCVKLNAPADARRGCTRAGSVEGATDDGEWRHAKLDLRLLLKDAAALPVSDMFFGCLSSRTYLICGFWGNKAGSGYGIDNFIIRKQ